MILTSVILNYDLERYIMKKIFMMLLMVLVSTSVFAQKSYCRSTGQGIQCYKTVLASEIGIVEDFLNKFEQLDIPQEAKDGFRNKVVTADENLRGECHQLNQLEISYAECYYNGLVQLRMAVVQGYNTTKKQLASR